MQNHPYTYLIGWSVHNKYYYGVRFAKNCTPEELWTSYKTSSNHVKNFYLEHGEPDVIQVRKIFSNNEKARQHEHKVLKRMNVINDERFLNQTDNKSISSECAIRGAKKSKPMKADDPRRLASSLRMKGSLQARNNYVKMNSLESRLKQHKTKTERRTQGLYDESTKQAGMKISKIYHEKKSSGWNNPVEFTKETGLKMAAKNNADASCPHCGKVGQYRAMKRWHFDNCKAHKII
jgi:hypothetical protein